MLAQARGQRAFAITAHYTSASCDGPPSYAKGEETPRCAAVGCSGLSGDGSTVQDCSSELDYRADIDGLFGGAPYLLRHVFDDVKCSEFLFAEVFRASGKCEQRGDQGDYVRALLDNNGTASVHYFQDDLCTAESWYGGDDIDMEALDSHLCVLSQKWYASPGTSRARTSTPVAVTKSSIGTGAIVGLAMGALAVFILIIGSVVHRRRSGDDDVLSPLPSTACRPLTSRHASFQRASSGPSGLWNDDVIIAKRIPKDKVHVEQLVSRGAFGEVYMGLYNHKRVAVKMLLPQMRGYINKVNEFLTEAKLTATMEHPHIVTFIGVAWDSLSDVCVVLEYMDGGDLRSLLSNYETTHHPVGFDRGKVTIALHVCHALAYMHSLAQPVIHRDLKSRNVLLNRAMEAKLTDFGVSRERLDRTMTAGVGTSLWMAPEVMMGKKYDDKADIFSFGVVISELDMHALPYAKALAAASANNQMAAAVLLQRVALGTLRVEFSQVGSRLMAELGSACVSVDPSERPTAAQILYRLQTILNRELL
ncbi:hypothetical protein PHYSODRAFT_474546 [Phytophthora sojae]|uniref:Protein kinase domain-containing protein n=1 Tax=Phytophthora sojae (strain P6497) TaxID=1094619 RepID=G4YFH4_PHYSP|nr:hypothetical protein PHYSODRAFT_474546 [Phytophthora sojae]EGZ26959.1 hypothetical protein PHYSODRAFT_474546 [Phytophthora sojae]|eukprot:XP_009514234.1 hypothetical protein PHYSODRAFT_474546 [Phytophthora sojae]